MSQRTVGHGASPGIRLRRSIWLLAVGSALAAVTLVSDAASATPTWTGVWKAQPLGLYGKRTFTLEQSGSTVTGRFGWSFRAEHGFGSPACFTGAGGTISGTVRGRVLTAKLIYPRRGGHARAVATLRATISRNGRAIVGQGKMQSGECSGVFTSFEAVLVRRS